MTKLKAGDVVKGPFVTKDGQVLNHYSVVLDYSDGVALLVYTTSQKELGENNAQKFSNVDCIKANWSKPCRWDASRLCAVPEKQLKLTGSITPATLTVIRNAVLRAHASRTLEKTEWTPSKVRVA